MKTVQLLALTILFAGLSAFTLNKLNTGYQVGDKATDFSLKNINDKNVSLKDFKDA